mgnify:CR=1 FL=1
MIICVLLSMHSCDLFKDDYEAMKPYDGSTVYHSYMITIDLKSDNATVQDALVERLK